MTKIIDQAFISLLDHMNLKFVGRATGQQMGKRRANHKGSSVEFSDYRRYIAGDDYRRIDWNALARFEKLFIKEYMEEREVPFTVIMDFSQSMAEDSKKRMVIKVAALFAFAALKNYDSVQCYFLHNGSETRYKKIRGSSSFYGLADYIESLDFGGEINLNKSIDAALQTMASGHTVIISDFLYDHKIEQILSKLTFKKQQVTLIHVLASDELKPSFTEHMRFKDSENGREFDVDMNASTLKLYQMRLNDYLKTIQQHASKYGASYFLVNAELGIDDLIAGLSK